jgi:hypothetical protein
MDLMIFPTVQLNAALRALRAVAVKNDSFSEAEHDFIRSIARIHGAQVDPDRLEPIALDELARLVVDPHQRKRIVQLAIVMALVEGDPGDTTAATVHELAAALDIPEQGVRVLYDLSHGHTMHARVEMIRRVRQYAGHLDGFPGFGNLLLSLAGLTPEDPDLAGRYRALANCAPGSFGRAVFDHFTGNGFAFPGEKHGVGAMVFHDIGHVLSGYGTHAEDEIRQAAFQAGFSRTDGFVFLLFGVLQFHLGLRITPVAKGERGLFDVAGVLRALERGAACRVDLGVSFDHFAFADMPLERVRRDLGVAPL